MVSFFYYPRLQTLFIGTAFFITFFTGELSNFRQAVLSNKLAWLFIAFFFLHLVSMVYTEHKADGWSSIETKFSFLAFPVFLPLIFHNGIDKVKILKFVNVIALIYILLSLGSYFFDYFLDEDPEPFMGSNIGFKFSLGAKSLHPTYLSFYFLTLILFNGDALLYQLKDKNRAVFSILLISVFSVFVMFLSSKVAFIGLILIIVLLLAKYAKQNNKIKQSLLIFGVFTVVAVVGIANSNLSLKFQQTFQELTTTDRTNESKVRSTAARMWFWKATIDIIKENPILGVGTGDVREELTKKYKEKQLIWIQDKGRDSHQQFLQTFATLGIPGILCLLLIFSSLFYQSFKNKELVLLGFTLVYFIFGLTESMFETQAGIVFFTFFAFFMTSNSAQKFEVKK